MESRAMVLAQSSDLGLRLHIWALAFAVAIAAPVLAIVLQVACQVYNKLAGAASAVPNPNFVKALGITLARLGVEMVLGFATAYIVFGSAPPFSAIKLIMYPVLFVVHGCLLTMLPTSLRRAFLVTLIEYAICLAISLTIMAIAFLGRVF